MLTMLHMTFTTILMMLIDTISMFLITNLQPFTINNTTHTDISPAMVMKVTKIKLTRRL